MHIQTLLEKLYDTETSEKTYNGRLRNGGWGSRHKTIANGTQSRVRHDADPHMVRKHNTEVYSPLGRKDGFNIFIEYLINNEVENIHFPRVYNIKKIRDKEGNYIHTYTIEKLVDIEESSVDRDQVWAFLNKSFKPEILPQYDILERRDTYYIIEQMVKMIRDLSGSGNVRYVIDESLKSAMSILYGLCQTFQKGLDLHPGNVMWRRGPQGLTLVFVDPFY